jgi:hypothetical protein
VNAGTIARALSGGEVAGRWLIAKAWAPHAERDVDDTWIVGIANELAWVLSTYAVRQSRTDNSSMSVGDCAHWHPIVEFCDAKVRERLCRTVIDAPRHGHLNVLEARSRSPPPVDDPARFRPPIIHGR